MVPGVTPTPFDLTRLVDSLPGVLFTASIEEGWPLTYVSQGAQDFYGFSPQELMHTVENWTRTVHPDDIAVLVAVLHNAVQNRARYSHEYRVITASGEEKWAWERGSVLCNAEGAPLCIEGFITDITRLKNTEAALRSSRRKYKSIFENSVEGIFQSRPDGSYIAVNPTLARIYGYGTPAEMLNGLTNIRQQLYVDPRRRDQFATLIHQNEFITRFESEIRRKDGRIIWISENARLVRTATGEPDYYEGTVEDITRRKRAELNLARERNMLRTLIDNWPDIIYVKDTHGRYILSNIAHTRLLRMDSPQEVEGRTAGDFFIQEKARLFTSEDAGIISTGQPILNREEIRLHPETRREVILHTSKLPLRDAHGEIIGLVCISRDITSQRQLEEQLRQSQKMEAIGRLAGGIAHDFNNLLTAILGYSEWIMHRGDANIANDAAEIHSAATRAAGLTQQLLTFSRKQLIQPKVIDLNSIVERLENLLRRLIGENIHLVTRPDQRPLAVCSDAGQLEQVLVNIVVNARDAMPKGGTIVIETSLAHIDHHTATAELPAGNYARFSVADNGSGIPEEIRERIFDPFFTTKEQGKGTGLGLATCYGIIKQNSGHITFQSELHVGTVFDIFLPLASEEFIQNESASEVGELPRGAETILLVEDDESVRRFTFTLLTDLGYAVLEACNGEEALRVVAAQEKPIDLLLTDVVMPEIGGKPLADRLAELSPATKVLFTSGYNEEALLQAGIRENHVMFLPKPFSPTIVAHKLREVLGS